MPEDLIDPREQQEADLRDHLIAWQEANPEKELDVAAMHRAWSEYIANRVLAGAWVPIVNDDAPNDDSPGDTDTQDDAADSGQEDASGAETGAAPHAASGQAIPSVAAPAPNPAPAAPGKASTEDHAQKTDSFPPFSLQVLPLPAGGVLATAGVAEQQVQDTHPALALEEFSKYAKTARSLEGRSNQAAKDRKKLVVTSEEQKQLMEMQQRLGIKQTGRYDNATRHALQAAFVELIRPAAEEQEKKYGIPAAVTIGQAILESGYGLHVPTDVKTGQRSNNFFGIKALEGQPSVNSWTPEYDKKGNLIHMVQPFAVYDDIGGSIEKHSELLKTTKRYKPLFSSSDPEKWAQGLQDAGYGGKYNKAYAKALIDTMRTWKLVK